MKFIYETMKYGIFFNFLINKYLLSREIYTLITAKYNDFIKSIISEEEYNKGVKYNLTKFIYTFFVGLFEFFKELIYIHYNLLPMTYFIIADHLPFNDQNKQVIFYILLCNFEKIIHIPFQLFSKFYIEQKFGFNTMTLSLFFIDFLKDSVLFAFIYFIAFKVALCVIDYFNQSFFIQLWIAFLILQIVAIIVYPIFIQPLFNKFTMLEEGFLKQKIKELANSVGFNSDKIFIVDGSKRSSHSNAYFVGFWNIKRIVLFDTLLKQCNEEEILGILAHELGHWYHNHIYKNVACQSVILLFTFYFLEKFIRIPLFYNGKPIPVLIKISFYEIFISFVDPLLALFNNGVLRYCEVQADEFACNKGHYDGLSSGLKVLFKENCGIMNPDWLYSLFNHSHPNLYERLKFIESKKRKKE